MKKIILTLSVFMLIFAGCGNKSEVKNRDVTTISSGKVAEKIVVGEKLEPITLKDQFDKDQTFSDETKKLIFVFKKDTGHTVNEFMKKQSKGFVQSKKIVIVADVSKMPSLIKKFFAIPDLKKSDYPILLLDDEDFAKKYQNQKHVEEIMIVNLDHLNVKNVDFLSNEKQLKEYLGK